MPTAPRPVQAPAMANSGMFFTEAIIVEAVWLAWTAASLSRPETVVNVPGNIMNPARRIHVKNEERMLCRRGTLSMSNNIPM
jgi:hypothetical protein